MTQQFEKKALTKKSDNISQWYIDVVLQSQLADYGPARGTMIIRPYGFAIWEKTQEIFNEMIRDYGVENAYFPLFIPYSLLEKEKQHIKGFSPELAVVTHGGGKKLKEPLVVRPTSETIMYAMYAKWIHSWRDLPLKINQWNNVVRWEKRTYPFLRTSEFLWQEGHTAHATHDQATEMVQKALEWYRIIYEEYYAVPVVIGLKSEAEKFAGALKTFGVEALMPDGKALQGATSHDLGQNFSKAFGIEFQSKAGKNQYVWQTSWGLSTRSLGGMFLVHGDDSGLKLPPKIAPIQVVIVPIYKDKTKSQVLKFANKIAQQLEFTFRVKLDDREEMTPGFKFNKWELKGVPVRVEVGPKEAKQEQATLKLRHPSGSSQTVSVCQLKEEIEKGLDWTQRMLLEGAKKLLNEKTYEIDAYSEFKEIMVDKTRRGFIKSGWCGSAECELKIKEETKATTRVLEVEKVDSKCIYCGRPTQRRWYFAQAY